MYLKTNFFSNYSKNIAQFLFFLSNFVQLFEKRKQKNVRTFPSSNLLLLWGRKETLRSQEIEKNVQIIIHLIMNSPRT